MDGSPSETDLSQALTVASTRIAEGWLDQAEEVLRPLVTTHPGDGGARRLLGVVAFKLGRIAEGIGHLRRATELSPGTFAYWSDLGVAHRLSGEPDAAAEAFARAAATPDAPTMWNARVDPAARTFSTDDGFHRFKVGDYDYEAQLRYGGHRGPHPQLAATIEAGRDLYAETIAEMSRHRERFSRIALQGDYEAAEPFWLNTWFPPLDGMALYTLLVRHDPARFVEVGSGTSTKFARMAVADAGLRTRLISIDPQPRAQIDGLCDAVLRKRLEDCDPAMFDQLEAGDCLFLDSSHRSFQNSDVTVAFLEILPRLKPGVLVHIHDIYLPFDYPRGHAPRLWNEQYLLATALLFGPQAFEMLFPSQFVARDADLSAALKSAVRVGPLADLHLHGSSFWMRKA
jgi:hypothetical protein